MVFSSKKSVVNDNDMSRASEIRGLDGFVEEEGEPKQQSGTAPEDASGVTELVSAGAG